MENTADNSRKENDIRTMEDTEDNRKDQIDTKDKAMEDTTDNSTH